MSFVDTNLTFDSRSYVICFWTEDRFIGIATIIDLGTDAPNTKSLLESHIDLLFPADFAASLA